MSCMQLAKLGKVHLVEEKTMRDSSAPFETHEPAHLQVYPCLLKAILHASLTWSEQNDYCQDCDGIPSLSSLVGSHINGNGPSTV